MSRISPRQFDGYYFDVGKPDFRNETVVVVSKPGTGSASIDPVASMTIDATQRGRKDTEQKNINAGQASHIIKTEDSGQRRFAGGNFDPAYDYVSWLGMSDYRIPPRDRPHILRGMIGLAVQEHGSIPHADKDLSVEGSRISQAMHRRYGIKPHPLNPTMSPTTDWAEANGDPNIISANRAEDDLGYIADFSVEASPEKVARAAQRMQNISDERRRAGKPKKQIPGQQELFP